MQIIPVDKIDDWQTLPSVISIMLYPEDEQKRNECTCTLAWHRKLDGLRDDKKVVLLKQDVDAIIGAPSLSQVMAAMARQAAVGQIAGELLLLALQLDTSAIGASLHKVRFLVSYRNSVINDIQGKNLWASDTSMKKAWKQYRTVAHLWAALKILVDANSDERDDLDETIGIEDILNILSRILVEQFASTSMRVLEKATGLIPSHQTSSGRPLLDIGAAWTFQKAVIADQFAAPIPALPDWGSSVLTEYRRGQT